MTVVGNRLTREELLKIDGKYWQCKCAVNIENGSQYRLKRQTTLHIGLVRTLNESFLCLFHYSIRIRLRKSSCIFLLNPFQLKFPFYKQLDTMDCGCNVFENSGAALWQGF